MGQPKITPCVADLTLAELSRYSSTHTADLFYNSIYDVSFIHFLCRSKMTSKQMQHMTKSSSPTTVSVLALMRLKNTLVRVARHQYRVIERGTKNRLNYQYSLVDIKYKS